MKKITRKDFSFSLKDAPYFEGDTLSVFVVKNDIDKQIVCTVVRNKKMKAVLRNRIKRVVRDFFYSMNEKHYHVIAIVQMHKIGKKQYITSEYFNEDFEAIKVFLPLTLNN